MEFHGWHTVGASPYIYGRTTVTSPQKHSSWKVNVVVNQVLTTARDQGGGGPARALIRPVGGVLAG